LAGWAESTVRSVRLNLNFRSCEDAEAAGTPAASVAPERALGQNPVMIAANFGVPMPVASS
jgi:hypothetical protein